MRWPLLGFASIVLSGASGAPIITQISPKQGGTTGWTRLTILGRGFDERGRSNDVYFGSEEAGAFCDPVPNECHSKRIVCITPSVEKNKALRGLQPLSVRSMGFVAGCELSEPGTCAFEFAFAAVPVVSSVVPEWIADVPDLTITGKDFAQGDPTVAAFDLSFWIGEEERCTVGSNSVSGTTAKCAVESIPFAGYQPLKIQMGSNAMAWSPKPTNVLVLPTIREVTPASGSTAGGLRVTVYGSAFSRNVADLGVTLQGVPCPVVASTEEYLVCVTGPGSPSPTPEGKYHPGKTLVEYWEDIAFQSVDKLYFSDRIFHPTVTTWADSFGGSSLFPHAANAAARLTTLFVPKISGNYTFEIRAAETGELWLGDDENPVRRVRTAQVDTDPVYDRRIASVDYYTSSYGIRSSAQSAPQSLEVGKKYWLSAVVSGRYNPLGFWIRVRLGDSVIAEDVLPGEFTEHKEDWKPEVGVVSNGVDAVTGSTCVKFGSCDFRYIADGPFVKSVAPLTVTPNAELTIVGAGFAAGNKASNEVTIGGVPCGVSSATSAQLACTLRGAVPVGVHRVRVRVLGVGMAEGSATVTAGVELSSVSFLGTAATLKGSGFGTTNAAIGVNIGGSACAVTAVNADTIQCTVDSEVSTATGTDIEVAPKGFYYANISKSFVFAQPFERPGTSKGAPEPWFWPRRGPASGGFAVSVVLPGMIFRRRSDVSVRFADQLATVIGTAGSKVTVLAPRATEAKPVNILVTHAGGRSVTLKDKLVLEGVEKVEPLFFTPFGGALVDVFIPVGLTPADDVGLELFGKSCPVVERRRGIVRCAPTVPNDSAKPLQLKEVDSIATINSQPATLMNAVLDGKSFTVGNPLAPAGGVFGLDEYSGPLVVEAKITPQGTEDQAQAAVALTAFAPDATARTIGVSFVGHSYNARKDKMFFVMRVNGDTLAEVEEGAMSIGKVRIVDGSQATWRLEIWPAAIKAFIDEQIVFEVAHDLRANLHTRGVVGVTTLQETSIAGIRVWSLRSQLLRVTVNGVVWPVGGPSPVFRSIPPSRGAIKLVADSVTHGSKIVVSGQNLRAFYPSRMRLVVAAKGTSVDDARKWTDVCTSRAPIVQPSKFTCTVSADVMPGEQVLRLLHYDGFDDVAMPVSVTPTISSASNLPTTGGRLRLTGGGFDPASTTVTVGGNNCPVVFVSSRVVVCQAPAGSDGKPILVTASGVTLSKCKQCKVGAEKNSPVIHSVDFESDGVLKIRGAYIGRGGTQTEVMLDAVPCAPLAVDQGNVRCRPMSDGKVLKSKAAITLDGYYGRATSTVTLQPGRVWAVSPRVGGAGATITLRGQFFAVSGATKVVQRFESDLGSWSVSNGRQVFAHIAPLQGRAVGGFRSFSSATAISRSAVPTPKSHTVVSLEVLMTNLHHSLDVLTVTVGGVAHRFTSSDFRALPKNLDGEEWSKQSVYVFDTPFMVATPASTTDISITRSSVWGGFWALKSVTLAGSTEFGYSVAVGRKACTVSLVSTLAIRCRTPDDLPAGQHSVVVTGADCRSGGECNFEASVSGEDVAAVTSIAAAGPMSASDGSVSWGQLSTGVEVLVGNALIKSGDVSAWDTAAVSAQVFDTEQAFTGIKGFLGPGDLMVGLVGGSHRTELDVSVSQMQFALHRRGSYLMAYDGGKTVAARRQFSTDVARKISAEIRITADETDFLIDGVVFYTSPNVLSGRYRVKSVLRAPGSVLDGVTAIVGGGAALRQLVAITGTKLAGIGRFPIVTVGTVPCPVEFAAEQRIVCSLPGESRPTGDVDLSVTSHHGHVSSTLGYVPAVFDIHPLVGGRVITIKGTMFPESPTVSVGGSVCTIIRSSSSEICCLSPTAGGAVVVPGALCVGDLFGSGGCGSVSAGSVPFTLSSASPSSVHAGLTLTFTGSNFPSGRVRIAIGPVACRVLTRSSTVLQCQVEAAVPLGQVQAAVMFTGVGAACKQMESKLMILNGPMEVGTNEGAKITLRGNGFVEGDTSLVTGDGDDLCTTLVVMDSTKMLCTLATVAFKSKAAGDLVLRAGSSSADVGLTSDGTSLIDVSSAHNPKLETVSSNEAGRGDVIIVKGQRLDTITSMRVGEAACNVIHTTADAVQCRIDGPLARGATIDVKGLSLEKGGADSSVQVTGVTRVASVSPMHATAGDSITLLGSGFVSDATQTAVEVKGLDCPVTAVDGAAGKIVCTVPDPGVFVGVPVDVLVRSGSASIATVSTTEDYTKVEVPSVTGVTSDASPVSAAGGDWITITGTNFGDDPTQTLVTIGGVDRYCNIMSIKDTEIKCIAKEVAGTMDAAKVVVDRVGLRSADSAGATLAMELSITSISPSQSSLEGGATLTITGTGFADRTKRVKVHIGAQNCPVIKSTRTTIRCVIPSVPRVSDSNPILAAKYSPRANAAHALSVTVNGTAASSSPSLSLQYSGTATATVTSVTPGAGGIITPSTPLTIVGVGFDGSGNAVILRPLRGTGETMCEISEESATRIVCTPASMESFGRHRVLVRTLAGFAVKAQACSAGQFLMCDGTCLKNTDCSMRQWGITNDCQQVANLISNDKFCHGNGGSDRIAIPLQLDSGKPFNMNCAMYSCEGNDCDAKLEIGGFGAVISTCGADPNNDVRNLVAKVSSVSLNRSSANKKSSMHGGVRFTLIGEGFGMSPSGSHITIGGVMCSPVEATGTQLVCETNRHATPVRDATLKLERHGVPAQCAGTACTGFSFSSDASPEITAVEPETSGFAHCIAGADFTLSGVKFGSSMDSVAVSINGAKARVSSASQKSIVVACPSLAAGRYSLDVVVDGAGRAGLGPVPGVRFVPTVKRLSHHTGTLRGGTLLTVTGSGFTSTYMRATASRSCILGFVSANTTQAVFSVPACRRGKRKLKISTADGTPVTCTDCSFHFDPRKSVHVTKLQRSGNEVTVTAEFSYMQQGDIVVSAGPVHCAIEAFSTSGLTCRLSTTGPAGSYPLTVMIKPFGFAEIRQIPEADRTIELELSVTTVSPSQGSRGGGQLVTISGSNFDSDVTHVDVDIGDSSCAVQAASATQIVCLTGSRSAAFTGAVKVTISASTVVTSSSTHSYTYADGLTPVVTSLSPNQGSTAGGTLITVKGTQLDLLHMININGKECAEFTAKSDTEVTCRTPSNGEKILENAPLELLAKSGAGVAYAPGQYYDYVDLWSRWTTWGFNPPPIEGDSATVNDGQTVVMDVSPPRLFLIIVMGHLKVEDARDFLLECTYVMINYGRFTVGTPDRPFVHKATIRLFGDRLTPEIPVHGSKVIALRHGALDMHGVALARTWTLLADHANHDATSIKVKGPVRGWNAGCEIVIASTDYKAEHAEPRRITGISGADSDTATIEFDEPLHYDHYGKRQCFGTGSDEVCIDEVAEVIMLSRNIVIEGDENTRRLGFGATMFLMPMGEDASRYVRMSFVELRDVGQQYIVGRYPVHFHVTHTVSNSYVNGTSVHRSLNRAFSIHGVNNNTYVNNVVYDTHGHSFFVEDGSELHNVVENNVVMLSRSSTSNLNTDVTPANFWMVSPLNYFNGNRACGSQAYGFWIAPFHPHSTGPTHSPDICPSTHRLGEFNNNVAHSNKKYGLNIFQYWWPKQVECNLRSPDAPAVIWNFTSWKNKIHGVSTAHSEIGSMGAVAWENLVSADNGYLHDDGSAFWTERLNAENMTVGLRNSVLIATTDNKPWTERKARRGINLPLGDNFFGENVTFVNYHGDNYAMEPQSWAARMSFCFPWGWEAVFKGLKFINSPNRALFRFQHHGILDDIDGSLTGTPHSQLVPASPIYDPSKCKPLNEQWKTKHKSLVCTGDRIRRFGVSSTSAIWKGQIWSIGGRDELVPDILHKYSVTAPVNQEVSIDFRSIYIPDKFSWKISPRFFQPGEAQIFNVKYFRRIDDVGVKLFKHRKEQVKRVVRKPDLLDSSVRYWYRKQSRDLSVLLVHPTTQFHVDGQPCPPEGCETLPAAPPPVIKPCEGIDEKTSWSALKSAPGDGQDVHVTYKDAICLSRPSGQYVFTSLLLEGTVDLFNAHCPRDGSPVIIHITRWIHIRGGRLRIGSPDDALRACRVEIRMANVNSRDTTMNYLLPWGMRSVVLENGLLAIHGHVPAVTKTQLISPVAAGDRVLNIREPVEWSAGQRVIIAATRRDIMYLRGSKRLEETEEHEIESVSGSSVRLKTALRFAHAAGKHTLNGREFDIGAEVAMVSRMVSITGGHESGEPPSRIGWALNVGCTDFVWEGCGAKGKGSGMSGLKSGLFQVAGAALVDVGQDGLHTGGIEIDNLISPLDNATAMGSFLRDSAIVRSWNMAISIRSSTRNFVLERNTIAFVHGDMVRVAGPTNKVNGNLAMAQLIPSGCADSPAIIISAKALCRAGAFRIAAGTELTDNRVASGPLAGYSIQGDGCGSRTKVSGNVAHSVRDGVQVWDHIHDRDYGWTPTNFDGNCRWVRGFTTYSTMEHGIFSWYAAGSMLVDDVVVVDTVIGLAPMIWIAGKDDGSREPTVTVRDSIFAARWPGQGCRPFNHICRGTKVSSQPLCMAVKANHPTIGSIGIMEAVSLEGEYAGFTGGETPYLWDEPDSYATLRAKVSIENVFFDEFAGVDGQCENRMSTAFLQHPISADTFHLHQFSGVSWGPGMKEGGKLRALSTYGPVKGDQGRLWMNYNDGKHGAYEPDAPNKLWILDTDGSFTGKGVKTHVLASQTFTRDGSFDRIGFDGEKLRTPQSVGSLVAGCEEAPQWNAVTCTDQRKIVTVVVEHLGDDMLSRRAGPVVLCRGDGMITPKGEPLCQGGQVDITGGPQPKGLQRITLDRVARFRMLAEDQGNLTLYFRGVPPAHIRLRLENSEHLARPDPAGVTLNLRYHGENAQSRVAIYADGVRHKSEVSYSYPWDVKPTPLTWPAPSDPSGTNFHNKLVEDGSTVNVLSVTVRGGSVVELKQEPVVVVSSEVAMPLSEFFSNKATFAAAMASVLGIDSSRMRFVNIVPGSRRRAGDASAGVAVQIESDPSVITTRRAPAVRRSTSSHTNSGYGRMQSSAELSNVSSQLTSDLNSVDDFESGIQMSVAGVAAQVIDVKIAVPPPLALPGSSYIVVEARPHVNQSFDFREIAYQSLDILEGSPASEHRNTELTNMIVGGLFDDTASGVVRFTLSVQYDLYSRQVANDAVNFLHANRDRLLPDGYELVSITPHLIYVADDTDYTSTFVAALFIGLSIMIVLGMIGACVCYYQFVYKKRKAAAAAGTPNKEKTGDLQDHLSH